MMALLDNEAALLEKETCLARTAAGELQCLECPTPGAALGELVKVNQDIKDVRGPLNSCEDAQERRELRKLMTALLKNETALLEKEARLTRTVAGEL